MMCADNAAMDGTRLVHLIYENRNNEGAYLNTLCEAFIHFALQQIRVENPMESCVSRIVDAISRNAFDAHISCKALDIAYFCILLFAKLLLRRVFSYSWLLFVYQYGVIEAKLEIALPLIGKQNFNGYFFV